MDTQCLRCDRAEVWSRGYCNRCYSHLRKSGELRKIHGAEIPRVLMQPEDEKPCRVCGDMKKGYEFWAEKKARDGKQNSCRDCNNRQVRQWKKDNPEEARAIRVRRKARSVEEWRQWKYGLTPEAFESMMTAQGGLCASCRQPPRTRGFVVDHDHTTGMIRGLLCSGCNTGLGLLGDSVEGLEQALAYLRRSTP